MGSGLPGKWMDPPLAIDQIDAMLARLIQASAIEIDGFKVNAPDGGKEYSGCWVRDFTMLCESGHPLITAEFIRQGLDLFFKYQSPAGELPDWVSLKKNPVGEGNKVSFRLMDRWRFMDNPFWLVRLMGLYLDLSKDTNYFKAHEPALMQAITTVPLDSRNQTLVFIDENNLTGNWGFTDTIKKTGADLFCSLLRFMACKNLVGIYASTGDRPNAQKWQYTLQKIPVALDLLFDAEKGLYMAAEGVGRKADIWGNAFGVFINAFPPEKAKIVVQTLNILKDKYLFKGQVRHLLEGEFWEQALPGAEGILKNQGDYQNGAYWGTPGAWVAYCLYLADPPAAKQMIADMLQFYQEQGIYECIRPEKKLTGKQGIKKKDKDYVASLALPYTVFKR